MNSDQTLALLQQLITKTKEGKLTWSKTSKANSYKLSLKNGNITIDKFDPRLSGINVLGDELHYTLTVYDENGEKSFTQSTGGLSAYFLKQNDSNFTLISNQIQKLFEIINDSSGSSLKNILDELSKL